MCVVYATSRAETRQTGRRTDSDRQSRRQETTRVHETGDRHRQMHKDEKTECTRQPKKKKTDTDASTDTSKAINSLSIITSNDSKKNKKKRTQITIKPPKIFVPFFPRVFTPVSKHPRVLCNRKP